MISPLVVGYPRTGFTLLVSVLNEILKTKGGVRTSDNLINVFCDGAGRQIAARIEAVFTQRGIGHELLYNDNFRQLTGGPKWLKSGNPDMVCFRKYIGIKGLGDFTLITSHPRHVLEYYDVAHSHVGPKAWLADKAFFGQPKFSSVRHPAGTLTSACFSLNALASEYIQKFVPCEADNDQLRQVLALYKLTDLNFFEALLGPYKAYLQQFQEVEDSYIQMRWEDLLSKPIKTIGMVALNMGLTLTIEEATRIWSRLDHVNLTGAHKHNLRYGHGVVGGWRSWVTNAHLDMICDYGFDKIFGRDDYDLQERLDEGHYTPFQEKVADAIRQGIILREHEDEDLFGFAFNKSNLDLDRFEFKRYEWRTCTQIERSSCCDDDLVKAVWDVAEEACDIFNKALLAGMSRRDDGGGDIELGEIMSDAAISLFKNEKEWFLWREKMIRVSKKVTEIYDTTPQLLRTIGNVNVVQFGGKYYGVPQRLGAVDFYGNDVSAIDGVIVDLKISSLVQKLESSTS